MNEFEVSYKQLNNAQRTAVDQIDGPVLVVAGPGTGKTQLLSMRVANILRKTDVDASNILCLTFTNKAALNMRERLLQLTGAASRNVNIKTFHSFAAELMNMYPDFFWNGARLSTAPDTTQIDIIQNIIRKLPLDNPLALRFAGNFTAGKDVQNALKYAKEAGLTPDKLKALISANIAYIESIEDKLCNILNDTLSYKKLNDLKTKIDNIPDQGLSENLEPLLDLGRQIKESLAFAISQDEGTNKTKNCGKWKAKWVQTVEGKKGMYKEKERNYWWLSLAEVYREYRNDLHQRGYYDYSDMIVEVISQLQNHPNMLADVQEKFQYILIDEFQDTNAAQLQLAHLIAGTNNDNNPNIMAVGDDDQSIYKFNGAELNNMLSFRRSYKNTKTIVLTENYRSSQVVLDLSKNIISQVEDRLVTRDKSLIKDLIAKNIPKTKGKLIHLNYPTEEQELHDITKQITETYKSKTESIAVLARDHSSLRRIASYLHKNNIPISYEQQNNILEHSMIKEIHKINSLLVAINNGDKNNVSVLLSQILKYPMWNIKPELLWQIATDNYRKEDWLIYLLKSKDKKLNAIANWLIWLAKESQTQPLQIVLEYVIGLRAGENLTSPIKQYYLENNKIDSDYLSALSALRLLRSLANDYSRSESASLEDFVSFIQLSIDTNELIADESIFVSGNNAVELLTVHKSKGLEFDVIYLLNAVDTNWKPNAGGRKCPANLPLQPAGDNLDDYARLMYVAVTRAKHTLVVSSYRQDINGKDVMATPLLVEALSITEIPNFDDETNIEILENNLSWPRLNVNEERLTLKNKIDKYSLSATGLLDFLDVSKGGPEHFLERHLLNLPQATTPSMAFGTAMHEALEYAQIAVNANILNKDKVLDCYEKSLKSQILPNNEFTRYLNYGSDLIIKLLSSETFWLGKGNLPEQSLNDIQIKDVLLNGKLDRIDIAGDTLTIIDYKTGKPLGSFTTRDQTKAIKAWRHKMQLIFYTLLIKNSSRFNQKHIKGQMWYLEASSSKELIREYIPSDEEVIRLSKLIEIIWDKIKTLNLPNISNYSNDYTGIQTFEEDLLNKKI